MAALIIPHNLSTGLIFLFSFYVVLVIGRYPFKHIAVTVLAFILGRRWSSALTRPSPTFSKGPA